MFYVYLIAGPKKGYIGKTCNFAKRWRTHKNHALKGSPLAVHRAIRKYGDAAFTFTILDQAETEAEAFTLEIWWIKNVGTKVPSGYNLTDGGEGASGSKHTAASKAKIGAGAKRRNAESRAKTGAANRLRVVSEATKRKIGAYSKQRVHTPETKAKISKSCSAFATGRVRDSRGRFTP